VVRVFVPRKFQATAVARIGGDLWGYLQGGREQADYYLAAAGTPAAADAELHGQLWARLGVERLDRVAFERLAAGLHPLTGQRLVKTSHVTSRDPVTGSTLTTWEILTSRWPVSGWMPADSRWNAARSSRPTPSRAHSRPCSSATASEGSPSAPR